MMGKSNKPYEVIIPPGLKPELHEIEAAHILADHFKCTVTFIVPSRGYKMKSADIIFNAIIWELKIPLGSSLNSTIERQFRGLRQSRSLIISGTHTSIPDVIIMKKISNELLRRRTERVLFITKKKQVITCK